MRDVTMIAIKITETALAAGIETDCMPKTTICRMKAKKTPENLPRN